ncbi:putative spermidine/putrescine transport system ATP-binding protein/putrescine transport system ATP-binding protein [Rhizobiales bacterium GAS191]|jgi:ABC-type Fe3+/spermidine/putrescine transport system ATPase subunit|nr:putative spermidine/putrescine transport system ATP-binding protein/putrescine transport system ATP-binding protein [Rhizobiales bacterium GAS113]SED77095.1 putative spermidine/putrescine transport system ATP-binding protein/putrescine transport system ATP-binding protein [Rhizobiales bacterium GAS191]SEE69257.1 putative spermidine/putrescine transport system ATP-binding protein/putrescine transport system ATP-binding protein [Rhizobiales bacterium GAS188]
MANTVEFHGVSKRFGEVRAIDDVSFSIAGGEIVALLGPSGCGKTTILRSIAGFERPDAGSIRIAGSDVTRLKPYERNVGLLFQHYALFPHMTVAENVAYGLRHRGHPRAEIPTRVEEMLGLVQLKGFGQRRPHQLSGGQQQRVALARALATRPGLILLDEPLSALDAKLRQDLRAELKQLLAAVGSTAIVVTHDQEEAMSLGERVLVMNRGRIVQSGPPGEVYGQPRSRFVADFLGRANWFQGLLGETRGGTALFTSQCGLQLFVNSSEALAPGAVELCVRPESIDLLTDGVETKPGHNRVAGEVLDVALLGAVRQVMIGLQGGGRVLALQTNRAGDGMAPGRPVIFGVRPEDCVLLPAHGGDDRRPSALT